MKKEFSTKWTGSSQPRKQRKYVANAPIHKKRKLLSVNLSKTLRTKHGTRNVVVVKGDKIKIMRGKFKGKEAKVNEVKIKLQKIYLDGMTVKKQDGSSANIPFRSSNLQIIELYLEDKKRAAKLKTEVIKEKKETPKKETKEIIKEDKTEKTTENKK